MSPGTSGKSSALVIFIINIKIFPFIYLLRKKSSYLQNSVRFILRQTFKAVCKLLFLTKK